MSSTKKAKNELKKAGFKSNGRCYCCGKGVSKGRIYASVHDSKFIGALLNNPASARFAKKAIQMHSGETPSPSPSS